MLCKYTFLLLPTVRSNNQGISAELLLLVLISLFLSAPFSSGNPDQLRQVLNQSWQLLFLCLPLPGIILVAPVCFRYFVFTLRCCSSFVCCCFVYGSSITRYRVISSRNISQVLYRYRYILLLTLYTDIAIFDIFVKI